MIFFCGKCLVIWTSIFIFKMLSKTIFLKKKIDKFWRYWNIFNINQSIVFFFFSSNMILNWIIWLSLLMNGSSVQLPQFDGVCAIMLGTNKFHIVSNHVQVFVSWNYQFFYLLLLELVLNTWIFLKVSFIFFMKKINC